jgi:hypothetical protein
VLSKTFLTNPYNGKATPVKQALFHSPGKEGQEPFFSVGWLLLLQPASCLVGIG